MIEGIVLSGVLYCGVDANYLEGITLPALHFSEISENIRQGKTLVWEVSEKKECLNYEIPENAMGELKSRFYYKDSCLLMRLSISSEEANHEFESDYTRRYVVKTADTEIVQWFYWRGKTSMKFFPYKESEPVCLSVVK
jgi:hypothetical protein